MRVKDFPELSFFKGHTLIVTDGTTLLGADDKAGVAEIMTAAAWLLAHPEIPHGKIRIGFTPDEEIGRGVDFFDVKRFGARFAYTVDGGFEGELEYENFNAASARIVVQGRNIHPGYAKDKMINALQVACEINSLLPAVQRPEHTQDYEGFYHLVGLSGTVEKASMEYIVRDHSRELFEEKKRFLADAVALLSRKYGEGTISLTVKDQYYNMREQVEPYPEVIGKAMQAMREAGVEPGRPSDPGRDRRRPAFVHGASVSEPVHGRHELSRQVRVLLARHDGPRRAHDSESGPALGRVIGRCFGPQQRLGGTFLTDRGRTREQ